MLLEGPIARVACAQANGEPFLLMVGAGFDARVVARARPAPEEPLGQGGLCRPAARGADPPGGHPDGHRGRPSSHRELGGHRQCAPLWWPFVLAPRTGILERGLEAILFKAKNRAVLVGQLMSLAADRLGPRAAQGGDVEMLACSHATVTAHDPCRPRSTATCSAPRLWRSTPAPGRCI